MQLASAAEFARAKRRSNFAVVIVSFLGNMSFSVVLPSLNKYVEALHPHGSKNELNLLYTIAMGAFGAGQLISAPICGKWADSRTYREVFLWTRLLGVIAQFVYALGTLFHTPYILIITRFAIGLAAGSGSISRSYFAETTTVQERTKYMGLLTIAMSLGYIIGPGIASLLALLDFHIGSLPFNSYTLAGWWSALMNILMLVYLFCYFQDVPRLRAISSDAETDSKEDIAEDASPTVSINGEAESSRSEVISSVNNVEEHTIVVPEGTETTPLLGSKKLTVKDKLDGVPKIPVFVCIACGSFIQFGLVVFEVISVLFMRDNFHFKTPSIGAVLFVNGIFCVAAVFLIPVLRKRYDEIVILVGSMYIFAAGFGFIGLSAQFFEYFTQPSLFVQPEVPLWRYLLGLPLIGCPYGIALTLISAIYSKVLGPQAQGVYQGYFFIGGTLVRTFGPVIAGHLYLLGGGFYCNFCCMVVSILVCVTLQVSQHKLVTHRSYRSAAEVMSTTQTTKA